MGLNVIKSLFHKPSDSLFWSVPLEPEALAASPALGL